MSFTTDMERWAKKANATISEVVVEFVLDLTEKIIVGDGAALPGTPVNTGWARNNWVATIGAPNTGVVMVKDKTGAFAMQSASVVSVSAPGNVWYLTNNVAYINRLEYGYSKQAPKGMVRLATMAAKKELSRKGRRTTGFVR